MSRRVSAEEARGLLAGATPGPWYVDGSGRGVESMSADIGAVEVVAWTAKGDTKLLAAAPDLAATVIALSESIAAEQAIADGACRAREAAERDARDHLGALRVAQAERDRLRAILYREGYAPCSSSACNCGGWHK